WPAGRIEIASARLGNVSAHSRKICARREAMPLEFAIHKMAGLPAANGCLKKRGPMREGYFADITIFDPKTVIDRATFADPNQYPVGINYVIVNGQLEVDRGQRTPAEAGRVLRGPGYRR